MSDPVTNIEIEDVLSSIRKLVSDGDKSRTRDPAHHEGSGDNSESTVAEPQPTAKPDKLVLTPAFLVPDSVPSADRSEQSLSTDDATLREMLWEEIDDDPTSPAEDEAHFPRDPEDILPDDRASSEEDDYSDDESLSDRSRLEATIAELEAAVSSDEHEYEPDGSEAGAETFYWPDTMARPMREIEDAETQDDDNDESVDMLREDQKRSDDSHVSAGALKDQAGFVEEPDAVSENAAQDNVDIYADDDLDDLLSDGGEGMDEEALRKLISEVVREELMGTLGERITRNVRKLVRREIYRILSSQEFD